MEKKLTVVFDDGCPMCTVGMNVADALDKTDSIEFIGMNTDRGKDLILKHNLDMNKSAYAFRADGAVTEKSHMLRDVLMFNGPVGFFLSLPLRVPYLNNCLYGILAWIRWHVTKSRK